MEGIITLLVILIFAFIFLVTTLMSLAIPVAIIGVVFFAIKQATDTKDEWEDAARQLNLEYVDGGTFGSSQIKGGLHGVPITVSLHRSYTTDQKMRGGMYTEMRFGNKYDYYTEICASIFAPSLSGVEIGKHGLADIFADFFGAQSSSIGDPAFDEEFQISGELGEDGRQLLLQPDVQAELRHLADAYGQFLVCDEALRIRQTGRITEAEELVDFIRTAMPYAQRLDDVLGPEESRDGEFVDDEESSEGFSNVAW